MKILNLKKQVHLMSFFSSVARDETCLATVATFWPCKLEEIISVSFQIRCNVTTYLLFWNPIKLQLALKQTKIVNMTILRTVGKETEIYYSVFKPNLSSNQSSICDTKIYQILDRNSKVKVLNRKNLPPRAVVITFRAHR